MINISPEQPPKPGRDALIASGLNQRADLRRPPDLDTQFEDLLGQIYDSERRERILDRVDAALRNDEEREKAKARRKPKP